MNCQQFREIMDSYISDELLVETNHEVLRHLENCPACRRELSAHRNLRLRLRSAVRNAPEMQINPAFASRLQTNFREAALRPKWWEKSAGNGAFLNMRLMLTAAMCLLVVAGFAGVLIKYRNSSPENVSIAGNQSNDSIVNLQPSESPLAQAAQVAWREITDFAIGDHKNCALEFRLKEKPITLEEASKKYGKFNKDLDKTVIESLREVFSGKTSGEIKLLEAHSCVFGGRRFAHVVLRRQNHIISVLVTDADLPDEAGNAIISQTTDGLQVAHFQTKHHTVFVISDLTAPENSTVAQTLSAAVRQHLEKFEV